MDLRAVWFLLVTVGTLFLSAKLYSPSRGIDIWVFVVGFGIAFAPLLTVKLIAFYFGWLGCAFGGGLLLAAMSADMFGKGLPAFVAFVVGVYLGHKIFFEFWPQSESEAEKNKGDGTTAQHAQHASGGNDADAFQSSQNAQLKKPSQAELMPIVVSGKMLNASRHITIRRLVRAGLSEEDAERFYDEVTK